MPSFALYFIDFVAKVLLFYHNPHLSFSERALLDASVILNIYTYLFFAFFQTGKY